jgi:hypothetical protein
VSLTLTDFASIFAEQATGSLPSARALGTLQDNALYEPCGQADAAAWAELAAVQGQHNTAIRCALTVPTMGEVKGRAWPCRVVKLHARRTAAAASTAQPDCDSDACTRCATWQPLVPARLEALTPDAPACRRSALAAAVESLAARAERLQPQPPAGPPVRAAAPAPTLAESCAAEPAGSPGAAAGPAAQEVAAAASAARLAALEAALARCAAVIGIEVDMGDDARVAAAPGTALGPRDLAAGAAGDGEAGLRAGRAPDQGPGGEAGLTAERLAALEAALAGSAPATSWVLGAAGDGCGGAPALGAAAEPEPVATAACGRSVGPEPGCRSGGGVGAAPLCVEAAPADGVVYVGCAAPAPEGKPAKGPRVTAGRGLGCGALRAGGKPARGSPQAAGGAPGARASKLGCSCVIS